MILDSVSIIIPCFQSAEWLPQTIDSCLAEKDYIKEIILVDDFSTDNSWNILQEYSSKYPLLVKIYKNPIKGGNNARNYGFSMSTGDYIQWLDADDQVADRKLELQLKCFNESVDIVYSDWILNTYQNDKLVRKEYKKNKQINDFIYHLLADRWSTPHCYLLKRNIAEKLNTIKAWNPDTTVLQDREYFTMAAIEGAKFLYTPGLFAIYNRWNKNSVSQIPNKEKRYQNMQNIFDRFEESIKAQSDIPAKK